MWYAAELSPHESKHLFIFDSLWLSSYDLSQFNKLISWRFSKAVIVSRRGSETKEPMAVTREN